MATKIIMPALGMAQETGRLLTWLRREGERVEKGDPIMEVETDKAAVEIEAPASGILRGLTARQGEDIPVGQTVAWILAPGETLSETIPPATPVQLKKSPPEETRTIAASPVARKIAEEHKLDLKRVKPDGGRIEKADVLGYLKKQRTGEPSPRLKPASPKARRLAKEQGLALAGLFGSGPGGAILAEDVLAGQAPVAAQEGLEISSTWQLMAERVTQSWTSVPHFYLMREVNASRLVHWRESVRERIDPNLTYTDLLVKIASAALRKHPRLNASWDQNRIVSKQNINIGLAVAVEDGLVVPVIRTTDRLSLREIANRRIDLVQRAQSRKLRPEDLREGTFTISNLGMYGVDAFNAIVNLPQAAILSIGRITDRVVPVNGQPGVQPMLIVSLSCDHRVVDGARGAQFLQTLAMLIEEPLALLE